MKLQELAQALFNNPAVARGGAQRPADYETAPPDEKFEVEMPDGMVIYDVPGGTTKQEVLKRWEETNQTGTTDTISKVDPSLSDVMGSFFESMKVGAAKALSGTSDEVFRSLLSNKKRMVPKYEGDEFVGFEQLDSEKSRALDTEERTKYINYLEDRAESPDTPIAQAAGEITGGLGTFMMDPVNIALLSRGVGLPKLQRFMKIFTGEAATGASIEAARQYNQGEEDPYSVLLSGLVRGAGVATADRAFTALGQIIKNSKMDGRLLNREIDKFEDRVRMYMGKGFDLNQSEAVRRAMRDTGLEDKSLREMLNKRNRALSSDLRDRSMKTLGGKIKAVTGRVHMPEWLSRLFTPESTVIRDISPRVAHLARRSFMHSMEKEAQWLARVERFVKMRKDIKGFKKYEDDFAVAVMKGDLKGVYEISRKLGSREVIERYRDVRNLMDDVYKELTAAGAKMDKEQYFFPRLVRDVQGLRHKLGKRDAAVLDSLVRKKEKKLGRRLSEKEMAQLLNAEVFAPFGTVSRKPGFVKERVNTVINKDTLKYYHSPNDALMRYIDQAAQHLSALKFFGKNLVKDGENVDIQNSVGAFLAREQLNGRITDKEFYRLKDALNAVFFTGNTAPSRPIQSLRNLFYVQTLGQFRQSATQIGDLGLAAWNNDMVSTAQAMFGKRLLTKEQWNLARKLHAEFSDTGKTAKLLDTTLKATGFKLVDGAGKNANINAAVRHALRQLKKNPEAFRKQWYELYGKKGYSALVNELKALDVAIKSKGAQEIAPRVTENIRLLAFHKLSDAQPVSHLEMPEVYLNNPNGRIFYMLKTFTIKQMDLVRRKIVREILHGNPAKGIKELMRYTMLFGAANMSAEQVKDWISGRQTDVSDLFVDSLWKNFAISEYTVREMEKGNIAMNAALALLPPAQVIDRPIKTMLDDSRTFGEKMKKLAREAPIVGDLYWNLFGDGYAEYLDSKIRREQDRIARDKRRTDTEKQKKQLKRQLESPEAKELRLELLRQR